MGGFSAAGTQACLQDAFDREYTVTMWVQGRFGSEEELVHIPVGIPYMSVL